MPDVILNKRVKRVYSPEQWAEARELYRSGLSLEGVAEKLGDPYSTVQYHAWAEEWGVRTRGGVRDPRYQRARARRIAAELKREETLMLMERALERGEELEILSRKCLVADSARAKVTVSRLVSELLGRLSDPSVPPRSAAQALGALAPIFRLLYGWGNEAEIQSMKLARKGDAASKSLVNVNLVNTTPQELAEMAKAKRASQDGQGGPSATECNGQGVGPSVVAQEQSTAATQCCPNSKKEAPPLAVNQPVQPRRETTVESPPPLSPQERRRQELEELARLRTEWRGLR